MGTWGRWTRPRSTRSRVSVSAAVVCARVYGYCDGTVVEFCLGIACIVIATVSLYIAGMLRDRRIQAEFARRHAERERRRAERENRGW